MVSVVWAGPRFGAKLEPVVEASFEARHVPWFASGYHGTFWILTLIPLLYEVLVLRTWFDHATSCILLPSSEGDPGQVPNILGPHTGEGGTFDSLAQCRP